MQHSTQAYTDTGIMLRAFACSGGSVSLFYTKHRGKIAGFTKRAPHPGDILDIHAEPMRGGGDLPRMITDVRKACGAVISVSMELKRIRALQAALELTNVTQPDGDPSPLLYPALSCFLHGLSDSEGEHGNNAAGVHALPVFEALLLEASGYRLSPDRCVQYPEDEQACYISPKTGVGVGATAGNPYKDKLFALPPSFRQALLEMSADTIDEDNTLPYVDSEHDFLQSCIITEHFLVRAFERKQFAAREKMLAAVKRKRTPARVA